MMKKIFKILKQIIVTTLLIVSVVVILRFLAFDVYYVPSNSMDGTIKTQEYIFTNKLAYGSRWFGNNKSFHIPGYTKVKRNDIVVFHFPEGDTIYKDNPVQNYYSFQRLMAAGKQVNQNILNSEKYYLPIANRIAYVKRCVALPGDTIKIHDARLYINEKLQVEEFNYKNKYKIPGDARKIIETLKETEINQFQVKNAKNPFVVVHAQPSRIIKWQKEHPEYKAQQVYSHWKSINSFPSHINKEHNWSNDRYGPLYVPKAGDTLTLSKDNLPIYNRLISVYEENQLEIKDSLIFINNVETDKYITRQNYYFMMGDNRYCSTDSRSWGFVPEDHLIGKAQLVLSSFSNGGHIRWNRIGKILK